MKKNLFLCGALALGLLVSCQTILDKKDATIISISFIENLGIQTVASHAQASMMGSLPLSTELFDTSGSTSLLVQDEPKYILIEVVPDLMKYDTDTFTVTAGDKVVLELDNLDGMQHNLLIAKPGTFEKVGTAADAMLRDPKAAEKHYIPEIPEVLFSTEMVDPGEVFTLKFTAPEAPGNYPFVCTFPGHWRMMNGIMIVEK